MDDADIKVNVNAEIKADLQPVIKHTPNALNKLFELLFGVKYAQQKRLMTLIEIQQSRDVEKLEEGLAVFNIDKKKLEEVPLENDNNKLEIISHTRINEEASNISGCAKEAVRQFIDSGVIEEKDLSKDFFNRWREEAKLVSEEYTQKLWGLVLAEEMKSPNTIPFRIMDVLRNLTKVEAELFNKMGQYVIFDQALVTGQHLHEVDINTLVEAGLVNFAGIYRSTKWFKTVVTYADQSKKIGHYINGNAYLIFSDYDPEQVLSLTYVPLTQAGQLIYKIAKKNNNWDIDALAKVILDQVKEIDEIITFPFIEIGKTDINTHLESIHKREIS